MSNAGGQFSLILSALLCKSISSWGGMAAHDKKAHDESHLISVSLDPAFDKPPVLRQYGLAYLDDNASAFSHWEFEDTTPGGGKKLAEAFGLEYSEENNQITHTVATMTMRSSSASLRELAARAGLEPAHEGRIDLSLTPWVPRRVGIAE